MKVEQIPCLIYTSNVYKISINQDIWLIDIGDFEAVEKSIKINEKVRGVFLTHAHYDHIGGVNDLLQQFPQCMIYGLNYTLKSLRDSKLNLSFYHENPIVYEGNSIQEIFDGQSIDLHQNYSIQVFATPGHNLGSATYILNDFIFTGDSYIPGYEVVSKLKSGNKIEAQNSLQLIDSLIHQNSIICPGHFQMFNGKLIK